VVLETSGKEFHAIGKKGKKGTGNGFTLARPHLTSLEPEGQFPCGIGQRKVGMVIDPCHGRREQILQQELLTT